MFRNRRLLIAEAGGALALVVVIFLAFHHPGQAAQMQPKPAAPRPEAMSAAQLQTARNLGKAYYEQALYAKAMAEFQTVVASKKAVATDYFDLGMALMQNNQLNKALGALSTAKEMAPHLTAIDYGLGILYKRELRYPEAEAALERVTQADPEDPSGWFNLGEVYFAQHQLQKAYDAQQHVAKIGFGRAQNFYVAAVFHLFTILVREGHRKEAEKFLQLHQEYSDKIPNVSLQMTALEGGKYGAILEPSAPVTPAGRFARSKALAFANISRDLGISLPQTSQPSVPPIRLSSSDYSLETATRTIVPIFGPSMAIGDYDGNGHPDLYIVNPDGHNALLRNDGNGKFTDLTEKAGVEGPAGAVSATFADYNNSGHPSLFVAGLGGVHLYENMGNGTFKDVTTQAGIKPQPGELDTRVVLFDADNDGFLDLLVIGYAQLSKPPRQGTFDFPEDFSGGMVRFYHNNGDGTFTDETAQSGLASVHGRLRGAIFGDFNNDGNMDVLFYRDDGPPSLYLNQTSDRFTDWTSKAGPALSAATVLKAQAADFFHDGNFDLALWTTTGYEVLRNNGKAEFIRVADLPKIVVPKNPFAYRGALADANGDSFTDILVADERGDLRLVANHSGRFNLEPMTFAISPEETPAALEPTWLAAPGRLDLVGVTTRGALAAWQKQGPTGTWLLINMDGYKSNKGGVGSIVELKAGDFYRKLMVTGDPVRVYTGGLRRLDVVRVTWPNEIVQNQVDQPTDQPVSMRESERMASSCPLLYAWNGKQFVFITDILGASPLGELAPDGSLIHPYYHDMVRLPDSVRPRDGSYQFQVTDEMREVDYVDGLRLLAVDHPANEKIFSNEIYSPAAASPKLFAIRQVRYPVSAVDGHGRNVLPLLLKADGRYVGGFDQGPIPGMAAPHSLTLDLGGFPASSHVSLWLTGWVYWSDSNGSRAIENSHAVHMTDPYLQVRNARGQWMTVIPDIGVPSGTNRTMRVDLTGKFLTSDHQVRIITNLAVYWDRAFFTTDERAVNPTAQMPLETANLHFRGFSVPVGNEAHGQPEFFQYRKVSMQAPWNPMAGPYTRYGNVAPLINHSDDRLVVMATGDEMTVSFNTANLPPLKPGWMRTFFLDATGYAKDGEPNTMFSKTSEPLPFRAMANYPPGAADHHPSSPAYRKYLEEYETRRGYALIPPLAPPVQ